MPRVRFGAGPYHPTAPRFRPIGRVVNGIVRPMTVVAGAERPWIRMAELGAVAPGDVVPAPYAREELERGQVAFTIAPDGGALVPWVGGDGATGRVPTAYGQLAPEELDHGQALLDTATGHVYVIPDSRVMPADSSWYIARRPSGATGIPLSVERPLQVTPSWSGSAGFGGGMVPAGPVRPGTDLTHFWPQLFPPGPDGGERPQTIASPSTAVAAGATVTLIQLAEQPRGLGAVIKMFGQTASDFTNLVWTFLVKGRPVDPISGIGFQFGQLFQPFPLPGTGVLLNAGDDFQVQVQNTGGVPVTGVRARVDLYQYRTE